MGPDAGGEAGIEEAQAAFAAGDVAGAAAQFAAILQSDPENADAIGGLAKCYIQTGDLNRAEQTLALVPPAKQTSDSYRSAKAALDLAKKAGTKSDIKGLEQAVAANPRDWDARFKLAIGLNAKGQRLKPWIICSRSCGRTAPGTRMQPESSLSRFSMPGDRKIRSHWRGGNVSLRSYLLDAGFR